MGILGPHGLTLHSAFADFLNVTVPYELADDVRASLAPLMAALGGTEVLPGELWQVPPLKRSPCGRTIVDLGAVQWQKPGSVVLKRKGQVLMVSASGSVLRSMRADGSFLPYLSILASYPHRVTGTDVTVDVPCPAAPRVVALYAHARRDGVKLGRKRTRPGNCRALLRAAHYAEGVETGTVYMGLRGDAEITGKAYDKRNEVIDRGGEDPGDLLRVELSFSGQVGVTLRDVAAPGPLFWHYAGDLLDAPADFVSWDRGDTGFHLDKLPPVDPVVAITRACERNEGVRTVIRFSDKLGIARKHLWGYMHHAHPVGAVS